MLYMLLISWFLSYPSHFRYLSLSSSQARRGPRVGLDIETGKAIIPESAGILDNYCVKKQFIHLGTMMATNLLLVDEVMRAGKKMGGKE